jgi:UDP-2,3-diacylglucosamine pyrophosphatase LpxH
MHDAVILSDIHLGADNCQARRVCHFLERIRRGELPTLRLILNGDLFDSYDFRRLRKSHWKVLSLLRKLSDEIEVVWLAGNHEGPVESISSLLGVAFQEEYTLPTGSERLLILHGHRFDDFLDNHPLLTWLGDTIYALLQRIDSSHAIAKYAKGSSKTFLRCAQKVQQGAMELARKQGYTLVCCGHTHTPLCHRGEPVSYFNSGCWTELPGTYLTVMDGTVKLHRFELEPSGEKNSEGMVAAADTLDADLKSDVALGLASLDV